VNVQNSLITVVALCRSVYFLLDERHLHIGVGLQSSKRLEEEIWYLERIFCQLIERIRFARDICEIINF